MKKFRFSLSIICVVLVAVLLMTSDHAYAIWQFASGPVNSSNSNISLNVNKNWFSAYPSTPEGQVQQQIVDNIVDSPNGLNNPNSTINQEIEKRKNNNQDTFGSMDWIAGDQASTDLGGNKDTHFIVQFPKDQPDTQYVYTTSEKLGTKGHILKPAKNFVPSGEYIYIIYRSTLKLNPTTNKWEEVANEAGYASPMIYQNSSIGNIIEQSPAFDPNSWQAGTLGTSKSNAIYSFVGQQTTAIANSSSDVTYYKFKTSSAGNVTVNITQAEASCKVNVYNNSNKLVKATSGAQGTKTITWKANRNAQYYIAVTGNTTISFTIS